jgi:hypothetical protein
MIFVVGCGVLPAVSTAVGYIDIQAMFANALGTIIGGLFLSPQRCLGPRKRYLSDQIQLGEPVHVGKSFHTNFSGQANTPGAVPSGWFAGTSIGSKN